jgi:hypothetical protein
MKFLPKHLTISISLLLPVFFGVAPLSAQDNDTDGSSEQETREVQGPAQSAFDENLQGSRNPFWPIGWKPTQKEEVKKETIKFERKLLKPSSILLGENPLAIINRKSYAVGELVPVDLGTRQLLFEITDIRDGGVTFKYGSRTFDVKQVSRY